MTPSVWLKELLGRSFLREYPVTVIYNRIDTSVFRQTEGTFRRDHGLTDRKMILGVADSWDARKGFSDDLRLAGMLDDTCRIVLVGVTKKQKESLPDNLIGIEKTHSREELAEIYTAADVFVNLTYEDNYPTVNLEAEACGTPVITYDTGGCRETLRRPDSVVVKRGDLE